MPDEEQPKKTNNIQESSATTIYLKEVDKTLDEINELLVQCSAELNRVALDNDSKSKILDAIECRQNQLKTVVNIAAAKKAADEHADGDVERKYISNAKNLWNSIKSDIKAKLKNSQNIEKKLQELSESSAIKPPAPGAPASIIQPDAETDKPEVPKNIISANTDFEHTSDDEKGTKAFEKELDRDLLAELKNQIDEMSKQIIASKNAEMFNMILKQLKQPIDLAVNATIPSKDLSKPDEVKEEIKKILAKMKEDLIAGLSTDERVKFGLETEFSNLETRLNESVERTKKIIETAKQTEAKQAAKEQALAKQREDAQEEEPEKTDTDVPSTSDKQNSDTSGEEHSTTTDKDTSVKETSAEKDSNETEVTTGNDKDDSTDTLSQISKLENFDKESVSNILKQTSFFSEHPEDLVIAVSRDKDELIELKKELIEVLVKLIEKCNSLIKENKISGNFKEIVSDRITGTFFTLTYPIADAAENKEKMKTLFDNAFREVYQKIQESVENTLKNS